MDMIWKDMQADRNRARGDKNLIRQTRSRSGETGTDLEETRL